MSDYGGEKRLGSMAFALNKLLAVGAPFHAVEIGIVMAIVHRGLATQPDSDDEACFLTDQYIAARTRLCERTVKRWLRRHSQHADPVLGISWPGQTFGTDGRWHSHGCARYTLLRTSQQVARAKQMRVTHQQAEAQRAAKRYRTKLEQTLRASKVRPARAKSVVTSPKRQTIPCPECGVPVTEIFPGTYTHSSPSGSQLHRCAGLLKSVGKS